MKMVILVPKVVQSYISQFPETTNNAYRYFNYDRRVVDERAETRCDNKMAYKGPEDLTDFDYDTIVSFAKTLINPVLKKYSSIVANEDALHLAIRSYDRGVYDGKINASKYEVLLKAMDQIQAAPVMAKKEKKESKPTTKVIPRFLLKRLNVDVKDVPLKSKLKPNQRGTGQFVKKPGKGIIIDKPESK